MALTSRSCAHTDAGSQYTSSDYTQKLDDHLVLASIGTVGDCYDNALAESFVDTYKTELIADRVWRTRTELELATVRWVAWFNTSRLHGSLGDIPPVEYEALHAALAATDAALVVGADAALPAGLLVGAAVAPDALPADRDVAALALGAGAALPAGLLVGAAVASDALPADRDDAALALGAGAALPGGTHAALAVGAALPAGLLLGAGVPPAALPAGTHAALGPLLERRRRGPASQPEPLSELPLRHPQRSGWCTTPPGSSPLYGSRYSPQPEITNRKNPTNPVSAEPGPPQIPGSARKAIIVGGAGAGEGERDVRSDRVAIGPVSA